MTPDERADFRSETARLGLLALLATLENAGISTYLTGALVRNLVGSERTSRDFDVVVDTHTHTRDRIRSVLAQAGYDVEGPLKGNLGERFVLRVDGVLTDIWLPPDTETARHEMSNRNRQGAPHRPRRVP